MKTINTKMPSHPSRLHRNAVLAIMDHSGATLITNINQKPLSPRECQVVQLLVGGLSQKEIANELGVSSSAVRCYMERVRVKTGQATTISAIAFVVIHDMVLINSV